MIVFVPLPLKPVRPRPLPSAVSVPCATLIVAVWVSPLSGSLTCAAVRLIGVFRLVLTVPPAGTVTTGVSLTPLTVTLMTCAAEAPWLSVTWTVNVSMADWPAPSALVASNALPIE